MQLEKRPLTHAAIASPYAGKQHAKTVYISSKTNFMSAFKRVKQLLKHIEKRETQVELKHARRSNRKGMGQASKFLPQKDDGPEPVYVKATGKAIDKALQLGLFLQLQRDLRVVLRTESVDVVDDIVAKRDGGTDALARLSALSNMGLPDVENVAEGERAEEDGTTGGDADALEDLPDSRIRHVSVLQIEVTLR